MRDYKFCPYCGTAEAIILKELSHYACQACGKSLWDNPKAAVGVVFLNAHGELLVAERGRAPQKGKYDLPGGFIDYNEDPALAVYREIQEETGLIPLSTPKIVTAYTHDYGHDESVCDLIMVVEQWKGRPQPQDDVAALHWRPLSFIHDAAFAWPYPGLAALLTHLPSEEGTAAQGILRFPDASAVSAY